MIAYCSGHMVKIITLRNRFSCNLGATLQVPPDQEKSKYPNGTKKKVKEKS